MKRIVTLALLLTAGLTAHAQGLLFDLSDVDSNGWLWFDTQEKIDKYIGDDKLIKMVPAQWQEQVEPDVWENPVNTVSPETVGAGTDGYLPGFGDNGEPVGVNPKRGAITLAPANPYTSFNGGGVLMHMPSCYYLSFYMSAECQIRPSIKGGHGTLETVDCANIKSFTFLKYASAGQCSWEVQDIVNLSEFCLKQETPVTAWFQNGNASQNYMYLHGIKALVYGVGTGVNETFADSEINIAQTGRFITLSQTADITVYNTCGAQVLSLRGEVADLQSLGAGVYIVQARANGAVAIQRVLLQ